MIVDVVISRKSHYKSDPANMDGAWVQYSLANVLSTHSLPWIGYLLVMGGMSTENENSLTKGVG
jgi:hypothetical protein